MPKLTPMQRATIRRRSKFEEPDPSELAGELNIIPFLDIVVNLIMFLLATSEAVLLIAQIEAQLPQLGRGRSTGGPKEPKLNLNVTITDDGVIVTGSGGKLAPGCKDTAQGRVVTVPKKDFMREAEPGSKQKKKVRDHDWDGLTDCAANIKTTFPDEEEVIIGADPMVIYEHVVYAMDALRGSDDKELFPKVLLSAGVR